LRQSVFALPSDRKIKKKMYMKC